MWGADGSIYHEFENLGWKMIRCDTVILRCRQADRWKCLLEWPIFRNHIRIGSKIDRHCEFLVMPCQARGQKTGTEPRDQIARAGDARESIVY